MFKPAFVMKLLTIVVVLSITLGLLPSQNAAGQSGTVKSPYIGMWISAQELANLPTSGTAWNALVNVANQSAGTPDVQDQDSENDVRVLAKALVYARTGDAKYRAEVINNLQRAIGTESGGRTLALGRNLVSYIIAADLINLPADPAVDQSFRAWLRKVLTANLDGRTLVSTHENRPNNWGTHAGASRAAVAIYLGDQAELARTAVVFRGWLGDRAAYSGFSYGDLSWQCNASQPVGINPKGCTKSGQVIDGALPEEMRRAGSFQWPPAKTGYAWEGMQGAVVQAVLLSRAGYPAFEWQDKAILRAYQFLYTIGWAPEGDDRYQAWLINYVYGTAFPTVSPVYNGKNMGWTDWTHSRKTTASSLPTVQPTQVNTPVIIQPTATPTLQPTTVYNPNSAPTATLPAPTQAPSSISWTRAITFENGSLINSSTGVDRVSGSVILNKDSVLSGSYSAYIPKTTNSYLQADFKGTADFTVSFLLHLKSLPTSDSRIIIISNGGTTVGNLVLRTTGRLRLRNGSTTIGAESAPLTANTTYIVGLRQKQGSGTNAVLAAYLAPASESLSAPFAWTNSGTWNTQSTFLRFGSTASGALDAHFDNFKLVGQ